MKRSLNRLESCLLSFFLFLFLLLFFLGFLLLLGGVGEFLLELLETVHGDLGGGGY